MAVTVGMLGVQACREPVDISGSLARSDWLDTIKSYDAFWYTSHSVLGTILNDAGCSPLAAGLQWLKAGAHANTEQEVETVGQGLTAARSRAGQPEPFDARLCRYVAGKFASPQQQAATRLAGISCA
jgi:hypothetical protein